jgi:ribosomal protein S18 acetylase RimI-like enzyme
MHIRTADVNDFLKLKSLYLEVARHEGGIARLEDEITDDYINNFIKKSLASGLILVAENPDNEHQLIAEIHAYKAGIKVFDHVLSELTLVVHPYFQGKKLGRTMLTIFLEEVGVNKPDIGKVELIVRESNLKAIELYQSMGFSIEGRMEMRIKTTLGLYEADIAMGWQNPAYEFD